MSDSTLIKPPSLAPIGYTALAIVLSLLCRGLFMPTWSPVEEPTKGLSFLIFWIMAVLPVMYLSFRRWAENSLESFMPQVFVFLVLSFAIQTALNATSLGFELLKMPHSAIMPFVWALPWLALSTRFKNSYITAKQCKSILVVMVPTVLAFYVLYRILPAIVLLAFNFEASAPAISIFALVALCYGLAAWCLRRNANRV